MDNRMPQNQEYLYDGWFLYILSENGRITDEPFKTKKDAVEFASTRLTLGDFCYIYKYEDLNSKSNLNVLKVKEIKTFEATSNE